MNSSPSTISISTQLIASLKLDLHEPAQSTSLPDLLRAFLERLEFQQRQAFNQGTNVRNLVKERARQIDKMLHSLWESLAISNQLSLIAVGGYGRGELHPFSDIDLLILFENEASDSDTSAIEKFISLLWDCRLKVGHAVRSVEQCYQLAAEDVTIATNLMESRLICGNAGHFETIKKLTSPDKIWDAGSFFDAKTLEQKLRYKKFDGSSFDLEPNVKSSPGGLRDIHLLGWIAQRTYYPKTLNQLIRQNVITKKEYYTLVKCQLYIWKVRFALHLVSGKAEDRLLFDYQKSAAEMMGFKDSKNSLAVEKMMKRYYRSALVIRNISDILLQVLEEHVRPPSSTQKVSEVDEHFQIVNQRVNAKDPKLFTNDPSQLLKVFQYIAKDNELKGITASTLRSIRAARYKITPSFRNNTNNKQLFVEFWHILHTSSRAMFLMKRSGVLADYLEAFRQITGQMQYDMFHNYTVDEHTLFLLKNLSDFADPAQSDEFPLCSEIMQRLKHPELIFLAGLFHDIAKGRGGDHSELGAIDAKNFCQQHQMDPEHSSIIEWLVANHLLMSLVAQKRDTSDPKVIQNFAQLVGNIQRLELLYILTVADIRATSNSLWNSWKDSLLRDLYLNTRYYLSQESKDISGVWQQNQ
ncbi:MAG: [protein-PII] uridylyltransferase, partial [Kangiellaceae bacterium]|nr:[protein-PII] uridylyltransferase [Kangiellaceae bacterium]